MPEIKIETGLSASDKKAKEILDSVIAQMSDGIWENSSSMDKYWKNLDVDVDGDEIIITSEVNSRNPFSKYSDDEVGQKVRDFFANKIKQIVKIEHEDGYTDDAKDIVWDRNCQARTKYLNYYEDITVMDAYRVYDKLKGRKDRIKESKKLSESAAIDMSTDDIIKNAANNIATLYNKLDNLNNELDKNFHNAGWRRNADLDSAMKLSDLLVELTYNVLPKYSAKLTDMANEGYHRG